MRAFITLPIPMPPRRIRNAIAAFFCTFGAIVALIAPIKAANAETVTLVAFGDSLTQGYGLPQEQGFAAQLQAYLTAAGDDVIVINAGVSGDTTAAGAARIDWTLTDDVDGVIVNLGGNDLLRGLPPEETRANLDKIAGAIAAKGLPMLIVAMIAPPNYGADYQAAFDAIYPEVAAKFGAEITPPYFTPITGGNPDLNAARAFMQDDGIHPNATGVEKLIAGHGPQIRALVAKVAAK